MQLFCRHRIKTGDTKIKIEKDTVTFTDTCLKCGKEFTNKVPYSKIYGEFDRAAEV